MSKRRTKLRSISGNMFFHDSSLDSKLHHLHGQVQTWRRAVNYDSAALRQIHATHHVALVYHSNRLEGNALSYAETERVIREDASIGGKPYIDQLEAKNLDRALAFAREVAGDTERDITQSTLRQIHALIVDGIESDAGAYRLTQNCISGSRHATPAAYLVPPAMSALSDAIRSTTELSIPGTHSPVAEAAAIHAQFLQIHPFSDGNGRTARTLLNLLLMRQRYPPCIIVEECRDRYIRALESCWNGDLTELAALLCENIIQDEIA